MLILTGSTIEDKTEVLCQSCYKVIGLLSQEEIGALVHYGREVHCFDCDDFYADTVHKSLYEPDGRYLLYIDHTPISINIWAEGRAKAKLLTQKNMEIAQIYNHLIEIFGGSK